MCDLCQLLGIDVVQAANRHNLNAANVWPEPSKIKTLSSAKARRRRLAVDRFEN